MVVSAHHGDECERDNNVERTSRGLAPPLAGGALLIYDGLRELFRDAWVALQDLVDDGSVGSRTARRRELRWWHFPE